ncbi:MAG: hypothetical protein K2Q45_03030 [Nitrosomonas sp.]|nr:hypothetical protein [Nitrosomonas sp.]
MTAILQMVPAQTNKEQVFNENLASVNIAADFAMRPETTGGLTWGYYGGTIIVDGTYTVISNGTIALSASTTNYIEMTRAGVVSKNTTRFTAGRIPLYQVVTDGSGPTAITDKRTLYKPFGYLSIAMSDADKTLTKAESDNEFLKFTGTLTAGRTITLPAIPGKYFIKNATAGGFSLTITCGGVTATVATATTKLIICDGTDMLAM